MTSLLGDLSNQKKGIVDNEAEKTIEFYVRGYTRTIRTINVQTSHQALWGLIPKENLCNENESAIRPINFEYNIFLLPEPDNQYDSNALLVVLGAPGRPEPTNLTGLEETSFYALLGYAPKEINSILKKHLEKLSPGWIHKMRRRGNKYVAKVAFKYSGLSEAYSQEKLLLEKFWDLVD